MLNGLDTASQREPELAYNSDGTMLVTWMDSNGDANSWGVRAQLFDSNQVPIGSEFIVNTEFQNHHQYE